ncbi:MAG: ATP-binding cassette domain-containing protein [Pseudomonadota bacterium]
MVELSFDLRLKRPDLTLEMQGRVPLTGVTAIMGPSGSGKTSLLRMLAGLEPGVRGEARFGDTVWQSGRRGLDPNARRVGFVFQDGRLFRHLSVKKNVAYGATRRGLPPAAANGIAQALGLEPLMNRRPSTLSGGETRRVALARALASGPDILFLDEPLSGLDENAKTQVLPYIARAVAGSGVPVLYVTHAQHEVTQLADRVLLVDAGRIVGWGRPPVHLAVTIIEARQGQVTVELGRTSFTLPGQGAPGDAREITLDERSVLLSRDAPGPSGALATLTAEVLSVSPRPSGPDVTLGLAGQRLMWRLAPGSALASRLPTQGEVVWLSLLSASLR